jgi:hypothetical protein
VAVSNDDLVVIDCLKHSIEDSQHTIRGYDTKAEILGLLLTLALGITNFNHLQNMQGIAQFLLLASWLSSLVTLCFLGAVLHPNLNNFKELSFGTFTPTCVYFLHNVTGAASNSVSDLAIKARSTDWVQELMYESMKLSLIREKNISGLSAL